MIFAASVLFGLVAGAGTGTTPKLHGLAEASKRATLVVFGQVVRVEQGARPIATLHIEHVAKGEAAGEVSFFADKVGCCLPRAAIGTRILAFLEPSGLESPRFRFVGDSDASLDAFNQGERNYVATTHMTGIQLPESVCDRSVTHGLYDCTAELDAALARAGLKPAPMTGRTPAVFRVVTRTCPPCEMGDWLQRAAGQPLRIAEPPLPRRRHPRQCDARPRLSARYGRSRSSCLYKGSIRSSTTPTRRTPMGPCSSSTTTAAWKAKVPGLADVPRE
jgi:hypothetical protein